MTGLTETEDLVNLPNDDPCTDAYTRDEEMSDKAILDRMAELAKDVVNCGQHTADIDIRFLLPGGPVDNLRVENEQK